MVELERRITTGLALDGHIYQETLMFLTATTGKIKVGVQCVLLTISFLPILQFLYAQASAPAAGNQVPLANGIYLVLQRSENPQEMSKPNDEQVILTDQDEFTAAPTDEPITYLLVARRPSVPLLLENAPTKDKDEQGKLFLRIKLAETHVPLLKEFTGKHIGSRLAVIIGGKVVSVHKIRTEIADGRVQISFCSKNLCEVLYVKLTEGIGAKSASELTKGEVASVREIGPLSFPAIIRGRDGGYSARFQDRSVWVFGDTVLNSAGEDGSQWRSSTWCHTKDFDGRDGMSGFDEPVDGKGAPFEFLPFTEEEMSYNKANNRQDLPEEKRSRYALWPGPVVVDPKTGKGYVFYSKIFARTGAFDFHATGYSVALWDNLDKPAVRPKVGSKGTDSTLLFPQGDAIMGQGAVIDGEWLYVYGCDTKNLSWPCIVARVRLADLLNRNEWLFFAGQGRWSKDWKDAVSVMDAAPMLTVHRNEYLGKYLAVYSTPLKNTISLRTADHAEGPWSESRVVAQCLAPSDPKAWTYSGLAHPELARDKGRVEYVSYYRETGFLMGEMRLIEIVFQ